MRRILLVLALAAAALVLPSSPRASACSCARFDVRESLPKVDGAFVGSLLSRDDPEPVNGAVSSGTSVRYRYQVEQTVKGEIPSGTVEVWAPAHGASCGMETPRGQRTGLLLRWEGDRWSSSLCAQVDPDQLIRAAQPLPPPPGKAPPAVLVGTTHGPGRMLSLDGLGRVVSYGPGDGNVTDVAFCPGGTMLAEAYITSGEHVAYRPGVAVRSAGDLTVAWERLLAADEPLRYVSAVDVACRGQDATEVVAMVVEQIHSESAIRYEGRIVAYTRDHEPRVLWNGEARTGTLSLDGRSAWVSGGPDGRELLRIDVSDGQASDARSVLRLPEGTGQLALAPDGRHLAGVVNPSWNGTGSQPKSRALVMDLSASPVTMVEAEIGPDTSTYNAAVWGSPDRIVFAPAWNKAQPVRLFDAALHEVGSWVGWAATHAAVVGDHLVGLAGPKVITASVATGPASQWADLDSGVPGTVVAFPDGAPIGPAGPPPSTTTSAPPKPTTTTAGPPSSTTTGSTPEPERVTDDATSTTSTVPPAPETPTPGNDVVALPEDGGRGTGGRPILVGGAGAALLAAGAAGLIRRRRAPKLPPL